MTNKPHDEKKLSTRTSHTNSMSYGSADENSTHESATLPCSATDAPQPVLSQQFLILSPSMSFGPILTPSPSDNEVGLLSSDNLTEVDENDRSIASRLIGSELRRRRYLHIITNAALVQEFLYLFFQYTSTANGLAHLGVEQNTAAITSASLSLADWLVNMLSISVPADADSILFPSQGRLSRAMSVLESIIKGISFAGSYTVGGSADALPLLALLPQNMEAWQMATVSYLLIAANILPAANYYRLFNHAKIFNHVAMFAEFCKQPWAPFKRLYTHPLNALRYLELSRAWLAVIGYRSIGFAFIAQALSPYLTEPMGLPAREDDLISDVLALTALAATATNVAFTRCLPAYTQLASAKFDDVSTGAYQAAVKELWNESLSSWPNRGKALLHGMSSLLPNAITAGGWALLASDTVDQPWRQGLLAATVGGFFLSSRCYVEYQSAVCTRALAKSSKPEEVNVEAGLPVTQNDYHPLLDLPAQSAKVNERFKILCGTFDISPTIEAVLAAVNIGARSARSIGFYGFVKVLTTTLSNYTGLEISEQQNIALCLILAPENFRNELAVFNESMREVIQSWQAKCYLEKLDRPGQRPSHLSSWKTISVCLRKSHLDYSLNQINQAIAQRERELDQLKSASPADSRPQVTPPADPRDSLLSALSAPPILTHLPNMTRRLPHYPLSCCHVM